MKDSLSDPASVVKTIAGVLIVGELDSETGRVTLDESLSGWNSEVWDQVRFTTAQAREAQRSGRGGK